MMVKFQTVSEPEELQQVVELQELVWGSDITPSSQLIASIHHGGVVITATLNEKLVGFCYGFAGYHDGHVYLASHMAAVHPDHRDLGLGQQLKEQQRLWALDYGYDKIVWTFDPLETRNAFLNLCKLGGIVKTYIPSMYGDMEDKINKGLPSDRFLVEWELQSDRVVNALQGRFPSSLSSAPSARDDWAGYDKVFDWTLEGSVPVPSVDHSYQLGNGLLIPVPNAASLLRQEQHSVALEWRLRQREHFQQLFANGYQVVGLLRVDGPVHYYVLEAKSV